MNNTASKRVSDETSESLNTAGYDTTYGVLTGTQDTTKKKITTLAANGHDSDTDILFRTHSGTIIEFPNYLKVANFKIAKKPFGKPENPEVEINPEHADISRPQAWSLLLDENAESSDGRYKGFNAWRRTFPWYDYMTESQAKAFELFPTTLWFYNTVGSIKEAAHRQVRIISIAEWIDILSYVPPGNAINRALVLNIPLGGYHDNDSNRFYDIGMGATIWASQRREERIDNPEAPYIFFCRGKKNPDGGLDYRGQGFLVWSTYN